MHSEHFQIAIVGGGPAGLAAALSASRKGARSVCLIDRRRKWGEPVQCAEFVPKMLTQLLPVPAECVAQRVTHLRLFYAGELVREVRAPGFVLHRERWEQFLARRAEALGVTLWQPAFVRGREGARLWVARGPAEVEIAADAILGADGPRSRIRESLGLARPPLARGLQHRYRLDAPLDTPDLHFDAKFGAGYAWCFPKGDVANVGIALDAPQQPHLAGWLEEFTRALVSRGVLKDGVPMRRTGGSIPIGAPSVPAGRGHVLLAGDAAGQANPLTGAGIYLAVACGQMAGESAAEGVLAGDPDLLSSYESRWRGLFGNYLTQAAQARKSISETDHAQHRAAVLAGWRL